MPNTSACETLEENSCKGHNQFCVWAPVLAHEHTLRVLSTGKDEKAAEEMNQSLLRGLSGRHDEEAADEVEQPRDEKETFKGDSDGQDELRISSALTWWQAPFTTVLLGPGCLNCFDPDWFDRASFS